MKTEAALALLFAADQLEALPRAGWVLSRVPGAENVAAHSFGVAFVAMLLADAESGPLNRERVLRLALLHDLQEVLVGDIPGPVKSLVGAGVVAQLESSAAARLFAEHPDYAALWAEYEAGSTREAQLVKAADKLQMMIKALRYHAAGAGDVSRFWENPANRKDYGSELAARLLARIYEMHERGERPSIGFEVG
jgi:putative hydrolase of HD superfamily